MNALDLYEYDGTLGSETPQSGSQTPSKNEGNKGEEPSLNDEVNQVIGQLGRLWGGFRKQSTSAFESARKEVGQVLSSAQTELGKRLSETAPTPSTASPSEVKEKEDAITHTPTRSDPTVAMALPEPLAESSSSISVKANQLFSRLQSSLPPNLTENFQKRFHDAQENSTIQQMRSTVTTGFSRLQEQTRGMTLAQAEEFVQQRSEALLKEASDFFKEAVKVIPPEEASAVTETAVWDGSDSWMVTTSDIPSQDAKGKGRSGTATFAGNRTAALMRRLRTDTNVLLLDPASEPSASVKAMYEKWKSDSIVSRGEFNLDAWSEERKAALVENGGALSDLHDQLVPSQMTEDDFWERYFFRVHQIEQDELRRKALFDETSSTAKDEEFSWEDEEEEKMSSTTARIDPDAKEISELGTTSEPSRKAALAPTSPRLSEDSYDHLSQTSGLPSRTSPSTSVVDSESRNQPQSQSQGASGKTDEEGDSDWE